MTFNSNLKDLILTLSINSKSINQMCNHICNPQNTTKKPYPVFVIAEKEENILLKIEEALVRKTVISIEPVISKVNYD